MLDESALERAARALHAGTCMTRVYAGEGENERIVGITPWDWHSDEARTHYRETARLVIEAFLEAQGER